MTTPYYTYRQFMIARHGEPLFRVPIDTGHGCPHRGEDGSGGCTFCALDGGRSQQTQGRDSLEEQIAAGVAFARERYRGKRFMAYVQAFTGTYASVANQRALYERIMRAFPFEALTIGTRPDCLPAETLDYLQGLARRTELWIELGIQTIHDDTLHRVRRGHDWACSRDAILALNARDIHVAAHVILGLPGENTAHFSATADALAALPVSGIKIHNLHVIRGSQLAEQFHGEPFEVMDEHDYADVLIDFLRRTPRHIPIMRIATDTPRDELIAPIWQMSKCQFMSFVQRQMTRRGVQQGDMFKAPGVPPPG